MRPHFAADGGGELRLPLRWHLGLVAGTLLAAIGVMSGCGSGTGSTIAIVQGEPPITRAMLAHRITIVAGRLRPGTQKASTAQVRERALRFLIGAEWLEGEAAAERVRVSRTEVEQRYDQIVSSSRGSPLADILLGPGMSRADGLLEVRLDLLNERLRAKVTAGASVNDTQVPTYYTAHARDFVAPASRRAFVVVTDSDVKAQKAKHALEDGTPPAEVARRYSVDPGSRSAGGIVTYVRGEAAPPLDRAVFATRPGSLVGPVAVPSAGMFYVFRVLATTARHVNPLREVAGRIRQTLIASQQQRIYEAHVAGWLRLWKQRTSCRRGYVIPECGGGPPPPAR
jgi:foldase protein PrsA